MRCSRVLDFLERPGEEHIELYGEVLAKWAVGPYSSLVLVVKAREALPRGGQVTREYNDFMSEVEKQKIPHVQVGGKPDNG